MLYFEVKRKLHFHSFVKDRFFKGLFQRDLVHINNYLCMKA